MLQKLRVFLVVHAARLVEGQRAEDLVRSRHQLDRERLAHAGWVGSVRCARAKIFASDREVVKQATDALRYAAGNFYVNDKPTGAVVGQQPFGGSRASGTNDKAGSVLNMLRWVSPRTIKETFVPPTDWKYPFLG